MKICFYPKKDVVLGQLKAKLVDAGECLEEKRKDCESYETSIIRNPSGPGLLLQAVTVCEARVEALEDQIELLESHDPPEVMCELEL